MDNLLGLLPVLACPLMMGLMMVWMTQGQSSQTRDVTRVEETPARQPVATPHAAVPRDAEPGVPTARLAWNALSLCLNWKVVAVLGTVGLVIWVVAPGLVWAALPVLVLAACPLSMFFMMRGMQGARGAPQSVRTRRERGHTATEHPAAAATPGANGHGAS